MSKEIDKQYKLNCLRSKPKSAWIPEKANNIKEYADAIKDRTMMNRVSFL